MTAILGINFHHADSSAALLVDGRLVGAVAEERLGRRLKHDPAFPAQAIRSLLAQAGLRPQDIDYIAMPRDTSANKAAKAQYVLTHPISGLAAVRTHFKRSGHEFTVVEQVAEACHVGADQIKAQLVHVEHHLAHISSAYYCSPFDSLTAGFSYDGSGDFATMMAARCEGTRIEVLDRVHVPNSLGFLYTAACQFIGFDGFGEEYKVMGLAPYGEDRHADLMREAISLPADGWFRLDGGYTGIHEGESGALDANNNITIERLYTDKWEQRLGPARKRGEPVTQREMDIARSCQVRFEEAAMHCFNRLHGLVPSERIAYAGGCALNGVANARLLRDTPFTQPYLQAAASDDGLSVGAALWAWHNVAGGKERFHMHHAYWGPEHDQAAIERAANAAGMPMKRVSLATVPDFAARLVHAGLVMGWYQGRSEWGPRALGNRSIIADPTRANMKDLINEKIKRREMFRPFAPTVLREAVDTYFEQDVFSPFMMHVVKIRPEWRARLPAVAHVDGTGRLQSIERATNPMYYQLIEQFGRLSGVPIVLNTSFNENEPIVDTPEQAVACFLRTGLDALCLGEFILVKPEHAQLLDGSAGETSIKVAAVA